MFGSPNANEPPGVSSWGLAGPRTGVSMFCSSQKLRFTSDRMSEVVIPDIPPGTPNHQHEVVLDAIRAGAALVPRPTMGGRGVYENSRQCVAL